MRVLVLSHMYPSRVNLVSGIFVHRQVQALVARGHEVAVISPIPYAPRFLWRNPQRRSYGMTPRADELEGIAVRYSRYIRLPGKWFHGLSGYTLSCGVYRSFGEGIRRFRPRLIHAYTATPDGCAGLLLRKRHRIPVVCSLLGDDINLYPTYRPLTLRLTRRLIRTADQLVTVSQALRHAAEKIAIPKNPIRVVYMGCSPDVFVRDPTARAMFRERLGIDSRAKVIVFLGAIARRKGVHELLSAFVSLAKREMNTHLIYIGSGPELGGLVEEARSAGIAHRVHFAAQPSHADVPRWLSTGDVFALPSYEEGLPLALLEAMSCGLPAVATRVGGIPEVVTEGETGVLVRPKQVEPLAQALRYVLADEEMCHRMGARARRIVLERFSWDRSAEELSEVYNLVAR
jgi:teichuronic acid biosynthesis glycosyltransferase TuaC